MTRSVRNRFLRLLTWGVDYYPHLGLCGVMASGQKMSIGVYHCVLPPGMTAKIDSHLSLSLVLSAAYGDGDETLILFHEIDELFGCYWFGPA